MFFLAETMTRKKGFQPIVNTDAKILILGSMPSEVSIQKQEYYGHPRNTFWPIMLAMFAEKGERVYDYSQRKKILINNKVAVWDVLQSCHREGSLDAAIKMKSIRINNFSHFFSTFKSIQNVFFNGSKAETIFIKHVLPTMQEQFDTIQYKKLPSTSPAYATISVKQKTEVWGKEIKITPSLNSNNPKCLL
jgi:hypoxanthine-DNA glycosylase